MSFDITPHLNPVDPWARSAEFAAIGRRLYAEKYAVGLLVRPLRVLEIGVRFGYSAACWLAAGARFYHGIDADVPLHGGHPGAPAWALAKLRESFPAARVEIDIRDSQTMAALPPDDFDLIHVDGDHTYAGARHDLEIAVAAAPRFILVDDLDCIPEVADAVRDVLAARKLSAVRLPTVRGDTLIQLGNR